MTNNQIKAFVERIERIEAEKRGLADDIKDIYTEAKGQNINVAALRDVIRKRRRNPDEQRAHEQAVEQYELALA